MKFKKITTLLLSLVIGASLAGCSKTSGSSSSDDKTIVFGATQVPGGDLLEHLKPEFEKEGYKLEIKIFNDYNTPNTALDEGSIDANLFQHRPFLNQTIEKTGYELTDLVGLYESPLLVYSYKIKSLDDLKEGDQVAIPNDPTNGSRALEYLEEEGLIKVNKDVELPMAKDIVENPKKLEFVEAEATQLPSLLPDVTCAFINGNFAVAANLDANENAIYTPNIDGTYENIVAVREEDKDSEKSQVIKKVLTSDSSREFLKEEFKGIIIPTF
ncbi:MAG: MetQ/NlpA family ABC transporter substrate-binding protein [Peptostreptococcaceae bacterium]